MCRTFPSPLTVAAVIGGYPHAPPQTPAMQRAVPAPTPVRPYAPWGMLAAIDLHGCESGQLEDRGLDPRVRAGGDRRHRHESRTGRWTLERFGEGEVEGWSAMQFIETSSITIHADEFSGRCFIDVFSCRPFDPDEAAAKLPFGGRPKLRVLQR